MKNKDKKGPLSLIGRFLPYYKKYSLTLSCDLLCAMLTTVCELVLPMIVRKITNVATDDIAGLTFSLIMNVGIFYVVLKLIDTAAFFYMASVGHIMGTKIETDMRRDFFAHLQKLSLTYFDNTKVGTLMSRITSDLFDVTEFAHHCPEEFLIASIKIIGAFVILCTINVPLTLIVFAVIPLMVVVLAKFRIRLKEGFRQSRQSVGELNSQVEDSLLGIHEVKAFANEKIEEKKFEDGNNSFFRIKQKLYYLMGAFQSSIRFFDGVLYIVAVIIGAIFLKNGDINAADFVAYMLYATMLLNAVRRVVEFTEQFQRGLTGIERFFEVMDVEPDVKDAPDAKEASEVCGSIRFENVTFSYEDKEHTVIKNLSLDIAPGENIALVGPSGGGKTTLCSLIPRFYDLDGGKIYLDGEDIGKLKLASLRGNIGIVQQNVYLFSGSVKDNISYGKPDATDEEIIEAAKLAGAHEFILELPDGYNTYVGERGVKLSGGQRQRISIARVFLKNPPVLILDEATSALDNESERLVQASLEKLAKGRTTITIAHRLTTIRNADRIIVLTKDGIAESGTHDELLKLGGIYSQLHKLYT